jgi:hypothetical protein
MFGAGNFPGRCPSDVPSAVTTTLGCGLPMEDAEWDAGRRVLSTVVKV